MKRVLLSMLVNGLALTSLHVAAAEKYDLLVGTYTQGSSEGIYRYAFDSTTGQIEAQPRQTVKSSNPSWLTLSQDQRRLFVVNENGPGQKDVIGKVTSFTVDGKTHDIRQVNQVATSGDEPTHSSLSQDGRHLFVANYAVSANPGGSLSVLNVAEDGTLSNVVQELKHVASQVNPERQAGPHVHSVVSLPPSGRYVYASDLGADRVYVYRYEPKSAERPLVPAQPASVQLPDGSGPRHLLFSRDGKHAYLTLEMSGQLAMFDVKDGNLVRQQLLELGTVGKESASGALHLSADGRFLYVSNRGTANQMLVFSVDPGTGHLKEIQRRHVDGDHPREFALDPTGHFLLIANQKSNQITVLKRDASTGMLGETVQSFKQDAPSDLKFLTQ
ncbi:lactonase family protein [Pseudomonas coleopterorum]|uniref:lactonase family protein n=1 Tax=Pseudomonas coleopterorum TaxID=1605838 RepID=UPI0039C94D04